MDRIVPNKATQAAYLAAAWSFVFAAMSFYWAAGGDIGGKTIAAKIDEVPLANDPVVLALTGALKALLGLLALALVQPGGRRLPRRLVRIGVLLAGIGLTLYGVADLIDHGLMVAGVIDTPEILGDRAARWHLFLWDPFWTLGGLLFLLACLNKRHPSTPAPSEERVSHSSH